MAGSDSELSSNATGSFIRSKRELLRLAQGRAIEAKMSDRGWTQADLSRATGLPRYTISRAVRGENVLKEPVLAKIAKALGMQVDDILRTSERATLDDLPRGVHSTALVDGDVWLRVNAKVKTGVPYAVEALVNHDQPLSSKQVMTILGVLAD